MRIHTECLSKSLDKGSATRRTCLVKHDRIDNAVSDPHALHVLTADIDDEINVGAEELSGLEVSHCLDLTYIDAQSRLNDILTVTGNT